MDANTILLIAIPVLVVLAALVVFGASRRSDNNRAIGHVSRETKSRDKNAPDAAAKVDAKVSGREVELAATAERKAALVPAGAPAAPVEWSPPDEEALGVTRRQFLNRSIIGMFGVGLAGFGGAVLAFLWPTLGGGFGSKIKAGVASDLVAKAKADKVPVYFPEGRFYLNPYPVEAVPNAEASGAYPEPLLVGMREGMVALYQKCPHLGCRVPWCETSQWFECPCHGSQYNRVGEKKGGPAPRGMDMFPITVDGGIASVDTGTVVQGVPVGIDTTGQTAEGPNCISSAGGH